MSGENTEKQAPDLDHSVEPGVWRFGKAEKASVIIDAEAYFEHMQAAMLEARRRIMLIGWDFDTRIHLARSALVQTACRCFPAETAGQFPDVACAA